MLSSSSQNLQKLGLESTFYSDYQLWPIYCETVTTRTTTPWEETNVLYSWDEHMGYSSIVYYKVEGLGRINL
jgi:hypothetical protein